MRTSFAVLVLCILLGVADSSPVERPLWFTTTGSKRDAVSQDQVAASPEPYEPSSPLFHIFSRMSEDVISNPVREADIVKSEKTELALPYSSSAQEVPQ